MGLHLNDSNHLDEEGAKDTISKRNYVDQNSLKR